MSTRRELQGITNDLRDTFISRYNSIDGYWALGFFQSHLRGVSSGTLKFDLVGNLPVEIEARFPETAAYYRGAFVRLAKSKNIPAEWITAGEIRIQSLSAETLDCSVTLTSDRGTVYTSRAVVFARMHDRLKEFRSGGRQGPTNQKGQ
ncbi:hypothetical protein ACOYW6_01580 [Parablastomonas sp. CN1-191]|uniref:hypothetical protein n=1 Tax=Parablastomonas sp. CN1-191 TaxID=3400908 RepID=UPI003BF7F892